MHLKAEQADLRQAHDDDREGYYLHEAEEPLEKEELVRVFHFWLTKPVNAALLFNLHLEVVDKLNASHLKNN